MPIVLLFTQSLAHAVDEQPRDFRRSFLPTSISYWASTLQKGEPVRERWIVKDLPTESEAKAWADLPSDRHEFLFMWPNPYGASLKRALEIARSHPTQILVEQYPAPATAPDWRALAATGATLVFWDLRFPTARERDLVDSLGFKQIIFARKSYPEAKESVLLEGMKTPFSITFTAGKLPRDMNVEGLQALPGDSPLLFVSREWPLLDHWKSLQSIQRAKRLRVLDYYPSEDHWLYLEKITQVLEIQVAAPPPVGGKAMWDRLGRWPLAWTIDWVHETAQLEAYAKDANSRRVMVLDQDHPLREEDRARLQKLGIPVLWIHAAN